MVGRRLGEAPAKNIPEEHSAGSKSQESRNSGTEVCATQEFPSVSHNPNPPAQKHPSNKMAAPVDFQCVLCDKHITGSFGNSPEPITSEGRCCNKCNILYVRDARMNTAHTFLFRKFPQWKDTFARRIIEGTLNVFDQEHKKQLNKWLPTTLATNMLEEGPKGEAFEEISKLYEDYQAEVKKLNDIIELERQEFYHIYTHRIEEYSFLDIVLTFRQAATDAVEFHGEKLHISLHLYIRAIESAAKKLNSFAEMCVIRKEAAEAEEARKRLAALEEKERLRLVAQLERETLERQQAVDKSKLKAESKKEQTKNANKTKELKKQAAVERAKEEERIAKLRYAEERRKAEEKRVAKAKKEKEQRLKLSSSSLM